jgi:low temperature requirement protein LtrA
MTGQLPEVPDSASIPIGDGIDEMPSPGWPHRLAIGKGRGLLLRERGGGEARVEPVELFFDLVFVFAATQLTHLLLTRMSPGGAGETLLLLMAVWSAWSFTTWTTSWFDSRTLPVRLLLIGLMLGSLFMSTAIVEAYGEHGLAFATAYVAIQVGRNALTFFAIGRGHPLTANFLRVLIWSVGLGILWIAGAVMEGDRRVALWALAVAIDYVVTWFGFPVPGLGHSRTAEWSIAGEHLAERNELFIILALGESILLIGAAYAELPRSVASMAAVIVAFTSAVALWWLYFDRGAMAGRDAIAHTDNPGWLGLSAYTYLHLPMVAGIILTAGGDELTIAHPLERVTPELMVLILGGPVLYLLGNTLFTWELSGRVPRSRLVAIALLVALVPLGARTSALALMTVATVIVIALVAWDVRGRWSLPSPHSVAAV